jgi:hypothetical protein
MNWFRSSLRSCAYIALFALALQLVVSFGHMHRDNLGLPPLIETIQLQILAEPTGSPADSRDQDEHPGRDHYCPICAGVALLGTGAPASAPSVAVSVLVVPFFPPEKPGHGLRSKLTLSFQARGPPII